MRRLLCCRLIEVEDSEHGRCCGVFPGGPFAQGDADDGPDALNQDAVRRRCGFRRECVGHDEVGAAINRLPYGGVRDGGAIVGGFGAPGAPGGETQFAVGVPEKDIAAFDAGQLEGGLNQGAEDLLDGSDIVEPARGIHKPAEPGQIGIGTGGLLEVIESCAKRGVAVGSFDDGQERPLQESKPDFVSRGERLTGDTISVDKAVAADTDEFEVPAGWLELNIGVMAGDVGVGQHQIHTW